MALTNCPECAHEMSDRAAACPKCGCPVEAAPPGPVSEPPRSGEFNGLGCILLMFLGVGAFVLFQIASGDLHFNAVPQPEPGQPLTDTQRIVGKWKDDSESVEFFANGRYRAHALLASHDGKWQIVEGNQLSIVMDSRFMPDSKWRYEFAGDTLTLTEPRGRVQLRYHREK